MSSDILLQVADRLLTRIGCEGKLPDRARLARWLEVDLAVVLDDDLPPPVVESPTDQLAATLVPSLKGAAYIMGRGARATDADRVQRLRGALPHTDDGQD